MLTRFTYDVDGLLQVEVIEDATGRRHELVLEQNPGLLDREEIARRLQALRLSRYIHATSSKISH